jgi:hypothetical protein
MVQVVAARHSLPIIPLDSLVNGAFAVAAKTIVALTAKPYMHNLKREG